MALPALNWRRLAPVTLAANDVNAALDAIYTAGTAVTYADGSARVPGTGSAWTWNRDTTNVLQPGATTAAYASPPLATALTQRVIFAGSTAAPTAMPVYQTDTRAAGIVYASSVKNAGAYSDWNSATPFTTGDCLGFARSAVTQVTAAFTTLNLWESQEAIAVQYSRVAPNVNTSITVVGAFVDPGATANGESDGRLYGLTTSGNNNYVSATFWGSSTDALFWEISVANQNHFGLFSPGSASVTTYRRFGTYTPSATLLSLGGEVPLVPICVTNVLGTTPAVLRQMFLTRDILSNLTLQNAGVPEGYTLGANYRTTNADTCVLAY
jgi:hypothetical protein